MAQKIGRNEEDEKKFYLQYSLEICKGQSTRQRQVASNFKI